MLSSSAVLPGVIAGLTTCGARASRIFCRSASSPSHKPSRGGHAGIRLDDTVDAGTAKSRLDAWIASRIGGVSRARIQASIRAGLVSVNGRIANKVSHTVKGGDVVICTVSELQPLRAEAENIPLDIVYEDDHLLVVNKPPHMVVHPAPGNPNGTLVNAILHHSSVSTVACTARSVGFEADHDSSGEDFEIYHVNQLSSVELGPEVQEALVRPGIVHRLDKGTSGLLVVAKNEDSHAHLAEQFKRHTIKREYISITCGMPYPLSSRIEVPIARDPNNRLRMVAISGSNHRCARHAASRYKVIEVLADGGAALVEWQLETGRTHQIRAHAKHLGVPLLGDETYGGTKDMALSLLRPRIPSSLHSKLSGMLSKLERPCLHASTLGFTHPCTGDFVHFTYPFPDDFSEVLSRLRNIKSTETC